MVNAKRARTSRPERYLFSASIGHRLRESLSPFCHESRISFPNIALIFHAMYIRCDYPGRTRDSRKRMVCANGIPLQFSSWLLALEFELEHLTMHMQLISVVAATGTGDGDLALAHGVGRRATGGAGAAAVDATGPPAVATVAASRVRIWGNRDGTSVGWNPSRRTFIFLTMRYRTEIRVSWNSTGSKKRSLSEARTSRILFLTLMKRVSQTMSSERSSKWWMLSHKIKIVIWLIKTNVY